METHKYICKYCQAEFIPTRRRVQKYCSDSCRSGAFNLRKQVLPKAKKKSIEIKSQLAETENKPAKTKNDAMSISAIGYATAGTLIADGVKDLFTDKENKVATKGDLMVLYDKIGRYHKITNLPPNENGGLPYFDLYTNTVKYEEKEFSFKLNDLAV